MSANVTVGDARGDTLSRPPTSVRRGVGLELLADRVWPYVGATSPAPAN